MSYTYTQNVGDGVQKDFPFSFAGQDTGYISTSNISVYVAGVPSGGYTIKPSSPNVVSFFTAPPVGAEVLIRRIMPKNVPYADFSRGNPFNQDTLNNTNLQMLYLIQEIYDGYLPQGFFFRVDIDMRGHKMINLGDGVDDGDSVNMKQHNIEVVRNNQQDSKIMALEDNLVAGTLVNYLPQVYTANGGEAVVSTINGFFCLALYIDGVFQNKIAGAYTQVGGVISFPEPLQEGSQVYMILGTSLPAETLYPTLEQFNALLTLVNVINSNYANKGANSDITSLSGLTTPLSISQGGTGNTVGRAASATKLDIPRGFLINLASGLSVNFDGSADATPGVTGVLPKANGGTGNISGTSDQLTTSRTFITDLSSTTAASFNGTSNNSHGVTGILPVTKGGTGATTVAAAQSSLDVFTSTGVVDGSSAAAGKVGEFVTSTGTPVTLTSGAYQNLTSITLTAGDWDLSGTALYNPSASTITTMYTGVGTASNSLPAFPNRSIFRSSAQYEMDCPTPVVRLNLTTNTTVYLVGGCEFSGGSGVTGTGYIRARRVR